MATSHLSLQIVILYSFVLFVSTGLENLYGMLAYCQEQKKCRRSLIGRHFGESWNPADCHEMCDSCKKPADQVDGKRPQSIDHFTVVCSMTWPSNSSEAGGDLVLIQNSLLLMCKWIHSYFDNVMTKFMINNRTDA